MAQNPNTIDLGGELVDITNPGNMVMIIQTLMQQQQQAASNLAAAEQEIYHLRAQVANAQPAVPLLGGTEAPSGENGIIPNPEQPAPLPQPIVSVKDADKISPRSVTG